MIKSDLVKLSAVVTLALFLSSCAGNSSEGLGTLPKAMGAADETSAIQALRTIATAQTQLKATRGVYGNFDDLTQAGMLDQRFAGPAPNLKGYRFTITASDSEYSVSADPEATPTQPTTGSRHFYLESSGSVIHVNGSQAATRSDPSI